MNTLKWQLEDLAFATLYPKRYAEIDQLVSERAPERDVYLQEVIEEVSRPTCARPRSRRRSPAARSTTSRSTRRWSSGASEFDDIYDLVGIRVLVDTVEGLLRRARLDPRALEAGAGRFKDYIAMPKFNLYQSLHTTVIGPEGKPVEVQIRT